jgi:hypothetical protein
MNIFKIVQFYNYFSFQISFLINTTLNNFLIRFYFLSNYYILNELIWQEGLMLDFLQKKIIDNWLKKFVIYSANLFSERVIFEKIIKFYLDLLIWPMHKLFIFEFNNVGGLLFVNLFIFLISFFFFGFLYFFI